MKDLMISQEALAAEIESLNPKLQAFYLLP